jgi:hypothetical protein
MVDTGFISSTFSSAFWRLKILVVVFGRPFSFGITGVAFCSGLPSEEDSDFGSDGTSGASTILASGSPDASGDELNSIFFLTLRIRQAIL